MASADAVVREVRGDELDSLLELYGHLHANAEPLPEEAELRARWESVLSNPMLHCFALEVEGRLVSTCALAVIPNLTHGARPYGLIENVVTHADHRRRGYGLAVLRRALQCAWREGCYKVVLQTGRDLGQVSTFYERAGFQRGGKTAFVAFPPEGRR
jgi:GNAT superfamily N-acetyltransferase